jgi:hypothetical protein
MDGKKSFVAYADWKDTFDNLPDEIAGKLIKHIFAYVNDENPISNDFIIDAVFSNIKNTLKRDLKKWESQLEQRRNAGKKSAEMRALTKINDRSISFNEKTRNSTVSDSVNVSVNEIKEKTIPLSLESDFSKFWSMYNKKVDSRKCKDKFIKLSKSDIEKIIEVLPSYIYSTPDIQFRKNPLTWLNGKCWEDIEINNNLPTKDKPFGKTNQI